jgi:tryptophanyl-tRNA synthetase
MTTSPGNSPGKRSAARVFSGIQPTGEFHIGNWLGAVRTWAAQVAEQKEDLFFCVVDAHAITVEYEASELRGRTRQMARDLVACGLDPERCTLFVQSDVREHTELAWCLANVTPMGDLGRMTQFKEKSEGREHVLAGLFAYPVLMAADVLLYKATVVPVGEDQLQHLELVRDTARRFNHRFGETFPEPQARMSRTPRVMGLDGQSKMSKSKGNAIGLFEDKDAFWNKLRGAFTDPQRLRRTDPGRPEVCNIYTMHKALSSPEQIDLTYKECTTAQRGCIDCKKILQEGFERELVPLRARREEIAAHPERVTTALADGAAKARAIAEGTMREVREKMGLGA